MESELIKLLDQVDVKCRERIEAIKNSCYWRKKDAIAEVRLLI